MGNDVIFNKISTIERCINRNIDVQLGTLKLQYPSLSWKTIISLRVQSTIDRGQ